MDTFDRAPVIATAANDPSFYVDPYRHYARWHAENPAFRWTEYGDLCFASHADVAALLRDPRFGRPASATDRRTPRAELAKFDAIDGLSLLELEPPDHTRIRRLVNRAFVTRALDAVRPEIERRCEEIVRTLRNGDDLVSTLAGTLPVETIALVLGVPVADGPDLVGWSHAMTAMYRPGVDSPRRERANDAAHAFGNYIRSRMMACQERPVPGVLRTLVEAVDAGDMTEAEAVATAILLLNAGHEATVHAIANGVRAILHARERGFDVQPWLADDRIEALVEETLRYDPPLHLFARHAYEDLVWRDCDGRTWHIACGERIALLLGAAGRDPRRFPSPDRFDPTRERADHLAFGGGIHFCLGASLARMELRIAVKTLFGTLPDLRLAAEPKVANTYHFRGYESLRVCW